MENIFRAREQYSPKCLVGEFSELRVQGVLRSSGVGLWNKSCYSEHGPVRRHQRNTNGDEDRSEGARCPASDFTVTHETFDIKTSA